MPHRFREQRVVARQRAQPGPGLVIEVSDGVGSGGGIEPVGLREHDVEADRHRPEPGQVGDQVRDPCPRPRPLAEFRQALFIDVDDDDRPCGLHAGIDDLEGIESPDPEFLDRRGIGNTKRGKSDQESET
jgi:hypothetical protein